MDCGLYNEDEWDEDDYIPCKFWEKKEEDEDEYIDNQNQ